MATAGSSNGFVPQQQRKPGGPRLPPAQGRGFNMQQSMMQMQFQPQMLPGGSVLLPNPMPGTVYQYQPGLMGPYIPNMSTQVIQTPMSYMQQPAYRSPAPIPLPQQPLPKRERKPLVIVDPNTKTVVQVSTPPPTVPAAATAAAVVNPPVPPGGHLVPGPYTMPPANVSQPSEQEQSSSNSVKEQFRLQVQDVLTRPQTTSPAAIGMTEVNALQLGVNCVNPGGLVAAPQPDVPITVPIVHSDQVISLPYNTPDQVIPQGGTDLTAETVATTEPLGGPPMMSIAEEFKAKVHSTLTSPQTQPIRAATPTEDHPMSTNEVEVKPPSVLPPTGGLEVCSETMSSASPLMGDKDAVAPEGEHEATSTGVTESRRDEEAPGTGEEGVVVAGKEGVVVAGKEGAVTVETDEEEDNLTKEVKFPDDLSDGSEKEEGEIDEEEEDLKKSSSPQQPPESIEPALQGDSFIKPKSRHAAVANASQRGGPRRYDREYLLQFRSKGECQIPPPDLLNKDCYKKNDQQHQGYGGGGGGGGGGGRRGSRQGERNEPRKIIPHSAPEKVELKKAEQPWQRLPVVHLELTEEQKETQEVFRKFQSILNKLTPQKFQKLADGTLQLKINTEERLKGVIDKIFTKALEETNFSEVYANLCRVLAPLAVETVNAEGKPQAVTFRRLLLTKCQQEFEKDKQEDEERETMQKGVETAETEEIRKQRQTALEAAEVASRHRSLGNIRFIGELYKLKILSESIMHECMIRLLKSASDEESLECFAKLMTTTGKDLDKEEAKPRIDTYFSRVNDIIKKGKISSRIKFALQDVVELRNNKWVPRQLQDTKVKTIDQIHREAEDEEQMTKQLASQYTGNSGMPPYGRRDSRPSSMEDKRGGRGGQKPGEEWSKVGGEKRVQQTSRPDLDRIRSMKKEKESSGGLRAVSKWGVGSKVAGTSGAAAEVQKPVEKQLSKPPGRSSSGGGGGGNKKSDKAPPTSIAAPKAPPSIVQPRRSSTHPDEKAAILQAVKEMTGGAAQKRSSEPPLEQPSSELDEATVAKRAESIVGEFCENKDLKEAVECVKEMKSPGMLHVFVSEAIKYALENTSECRQLVGQLFHQLLQDGTLAVDRMVAGLGEVMEMAEDLEIDVPKIWDYIGELLCPPVANRTLPLGTLISTTFPSNLLTSGKAALLTTKLLRQCVVVTSEEMVFQLWSSCKEQHDCLQLRPEDLEQLEFLRGMEVATPDPPHSGLLEGLTDRLRSANVTNDEIMDWIEKNCTPEECRSPTFIRTLTTAMVQGAVTGKGSNAHYAEEMFHRRLVILRKYVNSDENLELEVLLALQAAVAKLDHPPKLLYQMFNAVYDCEVVGENSCYTWRDRAQEGVEGKGTAIMSVKGFFDWLESAERESDPEGTSEGRQS